MKKRSLCNQDFCIDEIKFHKCITARSNHAYLNYPNAGYVRRGVPNHDIFPVCG